MNVFQDTMGWHAAVAEAKAERFGELKRTAEEMSERIALSIKLIQEESAELVADLKFIQSTIRLGEPPLADILDAWCNASKEASDVFFVVLQAMHVLGYTPEQFASVYAEVVRSNYSKLDNGVATFRDDGKLKKGPNYSQADVRRALGAGE